MAAVVAAAAVLDVRSDDSNQRQDVTPAEPAFAANAFDPSERSGNPATRSGLLEEITGAVRKRGGLRADARGNIRFRCPHCEHPDKTASWNPTKHGGLYQCFRPKCGAKGGYVKLAEQFGIKRRRPEPMDPGIFRTWQAVALTQFNWRGLNTNDRRKPTTIARAANSLSRTYVALCELAARHRTATIPASTRILAELSGQSSGAIVEALWRLRAKGLIARKEGWKERTRAKGQRQAALFRVHDLRTIRPDLFLNAPEDCEAVPTPETSFGALKNISVPWRRGGIGHAGRVVLAHLERGTGTAKSLQAATGFSQGTISKALRKLAGLEESFPILALVSRHGRIWTRTERTLADAVDGPAFDKARSAAAKQRLRHEVDRMKFDDCDLEDVLQRANKTKLPSRLGMQDGAPPMPPRTHGNGHQAHQAHARATIAGERVGSQGQAGDRYAAATG
jgi:hypothetical protein